MWLGFHKGSDSGVAHNAASMQSCLDDHAWLICFEICGALLILLYSTVYALQIVVVCFCSLLLNRLLGWQEF